MMYVLDGVTCALISMSAFTARLFRNAGYAYLCCDQHVVG